MAIMKRHMNDKKQKRDNPNSLRLEWLINVVAEKSGDIVRLALQEDNPVGKKVLETSSELLLFYLYQVARSLHEYNGDHELEEKAKEYSRDSWQKIGNLFKEIENALPIASMQPWGINEDSLIQNKEEKTGEQVKQV